MHALQAMAVVAALAIGLAAKLVVSPATEAKADRDASPSASLNVLQINLDSQSVSSLPIEKIHDMTFVDPE